MSHMSAFSNFPTSFLAETQFYFCFPSTGVIRSFTPLSPPYPVPSTFMESLTHPPYSLVYPPSLAPPPADGFYSSPAEKKEGC